MGYPARIDGILAREANMAVVFRRGPSRWTQQLVWNLDTDEVTAGQWIKGRVYTRRCDISPNGRYLVAMITNYSASSGKHSTVKAKSYWSQHAWTAISRPPYFTALSLWFMEGAWNGGGVWKSAKELFVNNSFYEWREAKKPSSAIRVRPLNLRRTEDEPIFSMRLKASGWTELSELKTTMLNMDAAKEASKRFFDSFVSSFRMPRTLEDFQDVLATLENMLPKWKVNQEGVWEKAITRGKLVRINHFHNETWQLIDDSDATRLDFQVPVFQSQWLDVDHNGRIIYADKGCLWAWKKFPDGKPKMIADLNANKFENVAPPDWVLEW